MIIALYNFFMDSFLPTAGVYLRATVYGFGPIVILLIGMMIMLSAVGIRVPANLGSNIVSGLFKGIGFLFKKLTALIALICVGIARFIPKVFYGTREFFSKSPKINPVVGNLLAMLITIIVIVIII